ncbi:hypothetical protein [Burkholderia pyrrocinia]
MGDHEIGHRAVDLHVVIVEQHLVHHVRHVQAGCFHQYQAHGAVRGQRIHCFYGNGQSHVRCTDSRMKRVEGCKPVSRKPESVHQMLRETSSFRAGRKGAPLFDSGIPTLK